jgi:hypothetical protein
MDYLKVYRAIVERGQVREPDSEGYYEVHHIIPRCMGGGDERENLTTLTAREHFIAHWLLARVYPDHQGIGFSFWAMCNQKGATGKRDYKVSSRTYAEAKEKYSSENSKRQKKMWQDPEYRERQSRIQKEIFNRPEYRERSSARERERYEDPEYREKQLIHSVREKERWQDPEHRKTRIERMKEAWSKSECKDKKSSILKERWKDPEYREKMSSLRKGKLSKSAKLSPEQVREIRSLIGQMTMKDIAKEYGTSPSTVSAISRGVYYTSVQ